jgi:addiction module RelB/DinJ family antitoxin
MTEMLRLRVDKRLLKNAHEVSQEMGTSTAELVRIFLKALVKNRQLPFIPKTETEEDELLGPIERRRMMADYLNES